MAGQFENETPQHREKAWSDEVRDADPQFNEPQPVYFFSGRTFKETSTYEPPK